MVTSHNSTLVKSTAIPQQVSLSAAAPLAIGSLTLTVRDLERVSEFYCRIIGLQMLSKSLNLHRLGAGGQVFLELQQDKSVQLASPSDAGLFHTAFLLPDRASLSRWLNFVASRGIPLQGASDHIVSEAVYLADPEGNGVEVYADRPAEAWQWINGKVQMATDRLNTADLMAVDPTPWAGAPEGSFIGHVHLQVGNLEETESFYGRDLGFNVVAQYPGANFYSSGGYHHHIGTNIWNSRGAGRRPRGRTGLARLDLIARDAGDLPQRVRKNAKLEDPWGTEVILHHG